MNHNADGSIAVGAPNSTARQRSYPPLTAYRVFYNDGSEEVYSAAAGITLQQARDYYMPRGHGVRHYLDIAETRWRDVIRVEQVTGPAEGA